MDKIEEILGRVRKIIADGDATQTELADYLGTSQSTVSEWMTGKYLPKAKPLFAMEAWADEMDAKKSKESKS